MAEYTNKTARVLRIGAKTLAPGSSLELTEAEVKRARTNDAIAAGELVKATKKEPKSDG